MNEEMLNFIDKSPISIISSIDKEGFPNTRAMLKVRKRQEDKYLYFSTNTSSKKVIQFEENDKACVYFYNHMFFKGLMLRGKMTVLQDKESKEMIWRKGDTMYYPEGVEDPDYTVLRFEILDGRYYHNFKVEEITK